MSDPRLDTAAQRSPTGMDAGARQLMLTVVQDAAGYVPLQLVAGYFRDRFGGVDDYLQAVESVWGPVVRSTCEAAVAAAAMDHETLSGQQGPGAPAAIAQALALTMPEPDFRLAIELCIERTRRAGHARERINAVLTARGLPWRLGADGRFQWTGDALVEQQAIVPALSALGDPRFSGGVRSEFQAARDELRTGTPAARKQAVHEAGCAVESAMKVLLAEHGVTVSPTATAQPLFDALVNAGIVPRHMERAVLGPMTPRNKVAGHGAGAQAHDVALVEAEAVVASSATSIAYLQKKLP